MATTQRRVEGYFEAAKAWWGRQACRVFTCIGDTASSLNNDYFLVSGFDSSLTEIPYFIWYNVNGAGVNPALPGKTAIVVAVATNATAAQVASATIAAINAFSGVKLVASAEGTTGVRILNKFIGTLKTVDAVGTSGFTLLTEVAGLAIDLGKTAEGIEIAMETSVQQLKTNQTGEIVADEFYTGATVSVSMSLIEPTKARKDALLREVVGGSVTPGGGTEVSGLGESKLYRSLNELGGMLILHPIRLADSDKSADAVLWKSAPKPQSLNFDGANAQVMPVEFTAYLDAVKDTAINMIAFGDWSQDGLDA